jgi:RNA polymerase sigma-70 factor (ECF subfamily)
VNSPLPPHPEPSRFAEVLDWARCGEPAAWEEIFRQLSPAVAGYLRVQGARDVDDLVSEVFINVFRGVGTFVGDESAFRSWVFVIAHHRLIDERRRQTRRPTVDIELSQDHGPVARSGEQDAFDALGTERVLALCNRLVPDQRDVLMLRIVGDLTIEQIALVVDKSIGAVKALQRRGLDALRRIVSSEGVPL